MVKFDMSAAWDDTQQLLKSHTALIGTIAGVFLFLPTLVVAWFGPTPIEPAANATFEQILATFQESARQAMPYQLAIAVVSAICGVGDALTFALKMIPTVIAVQLLMGLIVGLVAVLLIVPGAALGGAPGVLLLIVGLLVFTGLCAYLWGRIAVVSALIADRVQYNPASALKESWELTRDNGWQIFLFLFLVTLVLGIVGFVVGSIGAVIGGSGEGVGHMVAGVVTAGFAAVSGIVSLAITAAVYRQLASPDVFQ